MAVRSELFVGEWRKSDCDGMVLVGGLGRVGEVKREGGKNGGVDWHVV